MWECTECEVENDRDPEAEEGQVVTCVECGAEFEVVDVDSYELKLLDVGLVVEADPEDDPDDEWD